jgi:hypothetical protein
MAALLAVASRGRREREHSYTRTPTQTPPGDRAWEASGLKDEEHPLIRAAAVRAMGKAGAALGAEGVGALVRLLPEPVGDPQDGRGGWVNAPRWQQQYLADNIMGGRGAAPKTHGALGRGGTAVVHVEVARALYRVAREAPAFVEPHVGLLVEVMRDAERGVARVAAQALACLPAAALRGREAELADTAETYRSGLWEVRGLGWSCAALCVHEGAGWLWWVGRGRWA